MSMCFSYVKFNITCNKKLRVQQKKNFELKKKLQLKVTSCGLSMDNGLFPDKLYLVGFAHPCVSMCKGQPPRNLLRSSNDM